MPPSHFEASISVLLYTRASESDVGSTCKMIKDTKTSQSTPIHAI